MAETDAVVDRGAHRYRVVADWAKLPPGWVFRDVAAVAVDKADRVYVFNRGEHPMMVFDRDGNLLNSWSEGVFHRAPVAGLYQPGQPVPPGLRSLQKLVRAG